jgi:hypothetical protein
VIVLEELPLRTRWAGRSPDSLSERTHSPGAARGDEIAAEIAIDTGDLV